MTPRALLVQLLARGVELRVHGDRLAFRPRALDPGTLALLREHKAGLLELLGDEAAVAAARSQARAVAAREDAALRDAARAASRMRPARGIGAGVCPACRRTDFWHSRFGARACRMCHPPAPGVEVMP